MKKSIPLLFFIILSLTVWVNMGWCQSNEKIEISDLLIMKSRRQSDVKLGCSKSEMIKAFGKPKYIKKGYFVKFDFRGEMMEYDGAEFYFVGKGLEAFEITNSQFHINTKSLQMALSIGDKIDIHKKFNSTGSASITLQNNGQPWDEVLSIMLDTNQKIQYIGCGPD